MGHKTLVDGTAYDISGGKVLVDGTAYGIKKGRTLVDGTGYDISFNTTLEELEVGTSVYLNVDGVSTEFLVVHQGLPSSLYDSSCDGVWLLMKDLYVSKNFDGTPVTSEDSDNDYANSDIHAYLNGTFLGLLDSEIQSAVKTIKIPYRNGAGSVGSIASGSSGLATQVFLLAGYEVGFTTSDNTNFPIDGACLDHFSGCSSSDRIAYYSGSATQWWLRSTYPNDYLVWSVYTTGNYQTRSNYLSAGVRPALILPHDAVIDDNYNVVA